MARQREAGELERLIYALQWLHVLFGIFWFGSQLYLDVSIRPAIARLDPEPPRR